MERDERKKPWGQCDGCGCRLWSSKEAHDTKANTRYPIYHCESCAQQWTQITRNRAARKALERAERYRNEACELFDDIANALQESALRSYEAGFADGALASQGVPERESVNS